jgi:uncharacterized membrane protein
MMENRAIKGAVLATAAAMMWSTALVSVASAADEGAAAATVKCEGVNSCKGTSSCKSAENSCKGQNSCKGHGWLSLSETECAAAKEKAASDKGKN